ncbi:MAG: hypothetical protein H6747_08105 [Deltaproteobacteria bacterium]|nr:hypothetical protein [Deltaproteobacteria bacterium]
MTCGADRALPLLPVAWARSRGSEGSTSSTVTAAEEAAGPIHDAWSLLLAPPGAGKSHALKELAQRLEGLGWSVVFVELGGDTLGGHLDREGWPPTLADGRRVALVLDAIDEGTQAIVPFANELAARIRGHVGAVHLSARDWLGPQLARVEDVLAQALPDGCGGRWTLRDPALEEWGDALEAQGRGEDWRAVRELAGRQPRLATWLARPYWLRRVLALHGAGHDTELADGGIAELLDTALRNDIAAAIDTSLRDRRGHEPAVADVRAALDRAALCAALGARTPTRRELAAWGGTAAGPATDEVVRAIDVGGLLRGEDGDGASLTFDHAITADFCAARALKAADAGAEDLWALLTVEVAGKRILPPRVGGVAVWVAEAQRGFALLLAQREPRLALELGCAAEPSIAALLLPALLDAADGDYDVHRDLPPPAILQRLDSSLAIATLQAALHAPSRSRAWTAAAVLGSFRTDAAVDAAIEAAFDGSIDDHARFTLVDALVDGADAARLQRLEALVGPGAPGDADGDIAGRVLFALVEEGRWPAARLVAALRRGRPGYVGWSTGARWQVEHRLRDASFDEGPAVQAFVARLADRSDLDDVDLARRLAYAYLSRPGGCDPVVAARLQPFADAVADSSSSRSPAGGFGRLDEPPRCTPDATADAARAAVAALRVLWAPTAAPGLVHPSDLSAVELPRAGAPVVELLEPDEQRALARGLLRAHAPPDPFAGRRVAAINENDRTWRRLRRLLLDAISRRATDSDLTWLDQTADEVADSTWLRSLAADARRRLADAEPRRMTAADLHAWLAAHGRRRAIRSTDDLFDAAMTALDAIQRHLADKGSAWHVLWGVRGRDGLRRPKDEADLQASLADELRRALPRVAILREVQVAPPRASLPGEAPDLLISAHSSSGAHLEVAVEIKGSWHREVATAMETQLFDRYLFGGSCRHGIYLVVYFGQDGWDSNDRRKCDSHRHFASAAEAQHSLDGEARRLNDPHGRRVRAFVLDASQPAHLPGVGP